MNENMKWFIKGLLIGMNIRRVKADPEPAKPATVFSGDEKGSVSVSGIGLTEDGIGNVNVRLQQVALKDDGNGNAEIL